MPPSVLAPPAALARAQEQALRTLVDAIAVNATLAELHIGAAAAQGLTFELKRHIVETLASAGNSVLGLITSNIELIYSDMGDLQHDVRAGLSLSGDMLSFSF